MNFRIAETFTDSLARLTGDEQKAVKTTAFDLQLNPAAPGLSFHKLDRARDKHFWSVRVSADIRIIVHRTADSLLLCYVDHHDRAYAWAERRKIETHPTTGAAQIVEIRELVREIFVPQVVEHAVAPVPKPRLFGAVRDEELLGYGVPEEWLADDRSADEDSLFSVAEHLPAEAAEALLELATGGRPRPVQPAEPPGTPFEHPDARRRFQLLVDSAELEAALTYPWDKWTTFLHPGQRAIVEGTYDGPVRVSGSAGTGKTIVALHRAVHLARTNPDARVLLATFSEPLAHALHTRLRRLVASQPRLADRIDVHTLDAVGLRLHRMHAGPATIVSRAQLRDLLASAAAAVPDHRFSMRFLMTEWDAVVDQWHVTSWEAYRDLPRLGRKMRLAAGQQQSLWKIFASVREALSQRSLTTQAAVFSALAALLRGSPHPPYDYVVVDEAQDLNVSQLRFAAALGASRPDALFFTGDLGQRIFQQPFSWRSLGVDVRGRTFVLAVNYRTSQQIRAHADRLLAREIRDADGLTEDRAAVSAFSSLTPVIRALSDPAEESSEIGRWIAKLVAEGMEPHEIAVFCRSSNEVGRAQVALAAAGIPFTILDERVETISGKAVICTMPLAKGLEFRAVAVMACDDEVIPSPERIQSAGEESDLAEIYDTERHLLYVACTRAREYLIVTSGGTASEFLADLSSADRQ